MVTLSDWRSNVSDAFITQFCASRTVAVSPPQSHLSNDWKSGINLMPLMFTKSDTETHHERPAKHSSVDD